MIYKDLLLSSGGGIMSSIEKAEQQRDTATLLIGLGGTGVHCLRTLKAQVYERLKADNEGSAVKEYEHIRFLGVDTDKAPMGIRGEDHEKSEVCPSVNANKLFPLTEQEGFYIGQKGADTVLENPVALNQRKDLNWFNRDIPSSASNGAGAGAYRQMGRFLLMDRSDEFMRRIEEELRQARTNLSNDSRAYVHVFTGIGGGTGSGCFLDAFYMIKKALAEAHINAEVFGYIFMPDVNLSIVSDNTTRMSIKSNGYAAMQELDYCMRLEENGGAFTQTYKDGTVINWNKAPMNMCHLVSATNAAGASIANAYNYAMRVVSEYVMDFLTHTDDNQFDLHSQRCNYDNALEKMNQKKQNGFNLNTCILGAASASVPFREINTYLASELFSKFSDIGNQNPGQADVDQLAREVFGRGMDNLYDSLLQEIITDAGSIQMYPGKMRDCIAEENGNLTDYYSKQYSKFCGIVEKNGEHMASDRTEGSVMNRLQKALSRIICDLDRGPVFAQKLLEDADHSLQTVVAGLIEENGSRKSQELYNYSGQADSYRSRYESAMKAWGGRQTKGRFKKYNEANMVHDESRCRIFVYEKLDETLEIIKKAISKKNEQYYTVLKTITLDLVETFRLNREALRDNDVVLHSDAFSEPMMTICELRDSLEAEIEKISFTSAFSKLMNKFLTKEDEWRTGRNARFKIARLVNDFFVEEVFSDFANRTMDNFLQEKIKTDDPGTLAKEIVSQYIDPIIEKSNPLFALNSTLAGTSTVEIHKYLSHPAAFASVNSAVAERTGNGDKDWKDKTSALTDRIYAMQIQIGVPFSAYHFTKQYEKEYYASTSAGCHLYEGNPLDKSRRPIPGVTVDMELNDWRELPSILPQSLDNTEVYPDTPKVVVTRLEEGRELFEKAYALGLVKDNGYIYALDEDDMKVKNAVRSYVSGLANDAPVDLNQLNGMLPLYQTDKSLPVDGDSNERERILKDYFVSSPVCSKLVKKSVERIEKMIEVCRNEVIHGNDLDDYAKALFTGVITMDGFNIYYQNENEFGFSDPITLSDMKPEYPFKEIPLYQGFITFQSFDRDMKGKIRKETTDRLGKGCDEEKNAHSVLKGALSKSKFGAYAAILRGKAEEQAIRDFLTDTKIKYQGHCGLYGLPELD